MKECIFCIPNRNETFKEILFENAHAFAVLDSFPVSAGHLLIISKQHFDHWFVTPTEIQQGINYLLTQAYEWLMQSYNPDGFNIGANCEKAAGQTVSHLHYHIIPRYIGDHPNPAGGVRHVIPGKGYYQNN